MYKYNFINALFVLVIVLFACNSSNTTQNTSENNDSIKVYPIIKFDKEVYDFGRIREGEIVTCDFCFTNSGETNLYIERTETSCGCTVPEYDKKPIPPSQKSQIRVRFDSNGKDGNVYKTIRIFTNCENQVTELAITGTIITE